MNVKNEEKAGVSGVATIAGNASAPLDEPITMLDVLEQEKELEEEYAAVLGASDEKCCTYAQGAIARQALYSCLTCCPEAREILDKCAGICLACSYRCHENHELVELYTKRNFRCDCPTERLGSCVLNGTLETPKPPNANNAYNQNFQGLYCTCHRPYPDPERTQEEVMLQCAVCEDWFHLQHLEAPPAAGNLIDACSEMICGGCMQRHVFLADYTGLALKAVERLDESVANITVGSASSDVSLLGTENTEDNKLRSDLDKSISEIMNMGEGGAVGEVQGTSTKANSGCAQLQGEKKEGVTTTPAAAEEPACKKMKLDVGEETKEAINEANKCRRPTLTSDYEKGATFWGNNWRRALCRCDTCLQLYKSQKVEFLLNADDSAKSYEERGMQRAAAESSSYEQGIRALASIGHVQQIDAITEYNRMKDKLKEFLQSFAVSKKVVTEEDINRFFAQMRNENNASVGQPHFCR